MKTDLEGCYRGVGIIETFTGKAFDVANPDPELVCIEDIAHALSLKCRYSCHCKHFYSVAQHSLYASLIAQTQHPGDFNLALALLLHDAAEAYTGDICRPVKLLIPQIKTIEQGIQEAIHIKFGVTVNQRILDIIKHIDNNLLHWESRQLMFSKGEGWSWGHTTIDLDMCVGLGDYIKSTITLPSPHETEHNFKLEYKMLQQAKQIAEQQA